MNTEFFLIFDRRGKTRMVKTGPPSTKSGERFVKVSLSAPDSLWAPAKVETVAIEATAQNSATVPAKVDALKVDGVCAGVLVQRNHVGRDGRTEVDWKCTSCDFTRTWRDDNNIHWVYKAVKR